MSRYRFKHRGIICDAYEPINGAANDAAVFLYGFPATIGENAATALLRACGLLVLQPHYPGTYDSEGAFTPHTAVETVPALVEALSGGEVHDIKKDSMRGVPARISVCVGYSFGCIIALRALPYLTGLHSLILVAPAITYGKAPMPSGFKESGPQFLEYVRRSRPFTYRFGPDEAWLELYGGALNHPTGSPPKSLRLVLGLVGTKDAAFDLPVLQHNFTSVIQRYAGSRPDIKLLTVEGAGHSVSTLLNTDTIPALESILVQGSP